MRALVPLCTVLALSSCATGGLTYLDFAASTLPARPDTARLLLFRVGETPQYAVRSATVRVDGGAPEGLAPGTFQTFNVGAGTHRIVVDMWDVPGRCELVVDAVGGSERYFEVSPRAANAVATLPMALVPVTSFGTLLASGAVMMAGLSVETAGKACAGAFQVVEQPTEQALARLAPLRTSR